jgi:predicted acyltransferase
MKYTDHSVNQGRIMSLDVMRGMIMILLCAESCLVFAALKRLSLVKPAMLLTDQFFHHPWHGLHFWDLVQPAFMFMAGAALYISYSRKLEKGITWRRNFKHIISRSIKLLLFGLGLHCIYAGKPVWELWNVLTQLAFTTIIAYLVINKSVTFQLLFSVLLLFLTDEMYRFIKIQGFDQPFVEHHNFGAYMDMLLMGKINPDGWVAINIIPTAAHTIWGAVAGRLLVSGESELYKIKALLLAGFVALLVGFGLDISGITPIVKRISTSAFVFASGGWVLIMMAMVYWIVDVKENTKCAWVFTVMGMNAIFIYVFFETVGIQWLNGAVSVFTGQLLQLIFGFPDHFMALCSALAVWFAEWCLCYWLYRKKIFFKL